MAERVVDVLEVVQVHEEHCLDRRASVRSAKVRSSRELKAARLASPLRESVFASIFRLRWLPEMASAIALKLTARSPSSSDRSTATRWSSSPAASSLAESRNALNGRRTCPDSLLDRPTASAMASRSSATSKAVAPRLMRPARARSSRTASWLTELARSSRASAFGRVRRDGRTAHDDGGGRRRRADRCHDHLPLGQRGPQESLRPGRVLDEDGVFEVAGDALCGRELPAPGRSDGAGEHKGLSDNVGTQPGTRRCLLLASHRGAAEDVDHDRRAHQAGDTTHDDEGREQSEGAVPARAQAREYGALRANELLPRRPGAQADMLLLGPAQARGERRHVEPGREGPGQPARPEQPRVPAGHQLAERHPADEPAMHLRGVGLEGEIDVVALVVLADGGPGRVELEPALGPVGAGQDQMDDVRSAGSFAGIACWCSRQITDRPSQSCSVGSPNFHSAAH